MDNWLFHIYLKKKYDPQKLRMCHVHRFALKITISSHSSFVSINVALSLKQKYMLFSTFYTYYSLALHNDNQYILSL